MLGKSGPGPALVVACAALVACAHNVSGDKATGSDGKQKGAKEMRLENGEGFAKGIVTYPGGDRVDWRILEIPDKKSGALELQLTWKAPRPKLQLAFDVFDEWNREVVSSAKTTKKKSKGPPLKTASIPNAHGKYFIRIYAVGRGDAGAYTLKADFAEQTAGPQWDPLSLEIPEPPRLAAVPDVEVDCDEFNFDPKNKKCLAVCPGPGSPIPAPDGWPGCSGKCPKPDINNVACHATMPCPTPPDRRVASCAGKFPKCPDIKNPDPNNPNCDNVNYDPIPGRILKSQVQGDNVVITCSADGVGKGWTGVVLRGESDQVLTSIQIVRTDKKLVVGTVKLTIDQVNANQRVKFLPPPRSK